MFQYSGKSLFSRVSEGYKIVFFAASFAAAFAFPSIALQALLFALLFGMLAFSGFRDFKSFVFILPFLALADFGLWFFLMDSTLDIFNIVAVSNLRIFNLLMASSFYSFSTDMFALLRAMKKMRLPEIVYLPLYTLLRFLPEVERDLLQVRGLQKVNGITPSKPLLFIKSLFLPMLLTLFQKADEVAIAYFLRQKRNKCSGKGKLI